MAAIASLITSLAIFSQSFIQTQIKENIKLRVTGLCVGDSPGIGEFATQMAINAEKIPFDDVIMGDQRIWHIVAAQVGVRLRVSNLFCWKEPKRKPTRKSIEYAWSAYS